LEKYLNGLEKLGPIDHPIISQHASLVDKFFYENYVFPDFGIYPVGFLNFRYSKTVVDNARCKEKLEKYLAQTNAKAREHWQER
jgi:hypothetical protein